MGSLHIEHRVEIKHHGYAIERQLWIAWMIVAKTEHTDWSREEQNHEKHHFVGLIVLSYGLLDSDLNAKERDVCGEEDDISW